MKQLCGRGYGLPYGSPGYGKVLIIAVLMAGIALLYLVFSIALKSVYAGEIQQADTVLNADSESRVIPVYFDSYTDGQNKTFEMVMDDDWFDASAEEYNHKLAQLSMCMAISAFRPSSVSDAAIDPDKHLEEFLTEAGFTNLRSDDYDKNPSPYTVATVIGSQVLADEDGPYTLVACGVCGGRYKNEWMSNFTIGTDARHKGFNDSALHVEDRIFGYIAQNGITGRIKLWISGFSRGGAISNIVAADMVD
ncbi:MAG: hypothetical protein IKE43_10235 [Coriobacteriales bacterium]|nr:hypothetical protein [Coriobacteriales bacterium]